MISRILVYLRPDRKGDPALPEAGDLSIVSDNPDIQGDIQDLGGDLIFLLDGFPALPGLWVWEGELVQEEEEEEDYQLHQWRRPTTQEVLELSVGMLWRKVCA